MILLDFRPETQKARTATGFAGPWKTKKVQANLHG